MDKVWASEKWGFEITLPEGCSIKPYDELVGIKTAEILNSANQGIGFIGVEKSAGDCLDYLKGGVENIRKKVEVEIVSESGGKSEATLAYTAVENNIKWQQYLRAIDNDGLKLVINFWARQETYADFHASFQKYAATLKRFQPAPQPAVIQEPPPKPEDKMPAKKSRTFFSYAPTAFILLLISAGFIWFLWAYQCRALDVPYKAAWIVAHWGQINSKTEICAEPFCFNTDTHTKTAGFFWRYSYCNEHHPDLERFRLADIRYVLYWLFILFLTLIVLPAIFGLFAVVALQPVLFIFALTGVLPGQKPFYHLKPSAGKDDDELNVVIFWFAFIISLIPMPIAWLMYIWW